MIRQFHRLIIHILNLNMLSLKIFDNTCIRRCVYQKMKNLVDKEYSLRIKNYHLMDCVIVSYGTLRLLFVAYVMKLNYQIPSYIPFKIERDDPFLNYLKQNSELYSEAIPLFVLVLELFNFLCQIRLYRLGIQKKVWKFWYQMIVINQDAYNQLKMNDYNLTKVAKTNKVMNRFHQYKIASMIPDFLIYYFVLFYAKYLIQSNLENIDRDKFLNIKIHDPPNLPIKYRIKLMNILVVGDNIWFGFQIFTCNVYLHFIF